MTRAVIPIFVLGLGAGLLASPPADEQTEDHAEQDRRYYERYGDVERDEVAPEERSRKAFLARAEQLVRDRDYFSRSSDGYRVHSDDPELSTRRTLELLESFREFFETFWTDRLALVEPGERARVFVYRSFREYNQLLAFDARFLENRPRGHYLTAYDVVAIHSGEPDLEDALVHEAAHQLTGTRIFTRAAPSPWIAEGLATYFGHTRRDGSGRFVAGVIGGKGVSVKGDGRPPETRRRRRMVRSVRRALGTGGGRALVDRLMDVGYSGAFYRDATVEQSYAASWMLVHFLFHGDDGALAESFVDYLKLEARGRGGPEAFAEVVDPTAERIERHVRGLKVR